MNTNVMQARCPITFVTDIAKRLERARKQAGLSQEQVAERAGVTQGTIGNIEAGLRKSPRELLAIAAAVGVSPQWLKTGRDPADPQSPEVVPPFGGPQSGVTLTQELSRLRPTMDPPTIEWGDTLHAKLPPRFILALPDDALAPDFPAGTRISWSTKKPPRVGSVVLVRDLHGQAHAREYTQGRAPGQWIAAPTGRAFASLDGAEITLLAVAEFEYRPLP